MFTNVIAFTAAVLAFAYEPVSAPQKRNIIATEKLFQNGLSIIAHRGGSLEGRENSLSAIRQSAQVGAHGITIDVRLTKDKKFVCIKDANLERLTGQNQQVSQTNYEEIQPYQDSFFNEYGELFTLDNGLEQERPPLLEEVLQEMDKNAMLIFIRYELSNDFMVSAMLKKVKEAGLLNRTALIRDENHEVIKQQFGQSLSIMESQDKAFQYYQQFFDGTMRTSQSISTDIFSTPYNFKTIQDAPTQVQQQTMQTQSEQTETLIDFVEEIQNYENRIQIMNQKFQEKGVPVVYWLCNHQEDFDKAIELRANAIITDRPAHVYVHMLEQRETNNIIQKVSGSYEHSK